MKIKMTSVIFLFFLAFSTVAHAASDPVTPSKCVVTIERFELKNNTGEWITVISPDLQVDLAVKDPTLSFSNAGGKIPPGNYINFRIILSETFKVSGKDHENLTKEGGDVTISGTAHELRDLPGVFTAYKETEPTWNLASEGAFKIHLNFNSADSDEEMTLTRRRDFAEALEIKKGSFVYVWFLMDLQKTLYFAEAASLSNGWPKDRAFYFLPPKQIDTVLLTVDGRKEEMKGDDVVLWF